MCIVVYMVEIDDCFGVGKVSLRIGLLLFAKLFN